MIAKRLHFLKINFDSCNPLLTLCHNESLFCLICLNILLPNYNILLLDLKSPVLKSDTFVPHFREWVRFLPTRLYNIMENSTDLIYHYKLPFRRNFNILAIDYKVIYFNTQKNANSSMKAQFIDILNLPKSEIFPKDIHYNYDFPTASKNEISTKYQDFLKFAILRNPWERLYSCYKNKIEKSSTTGADYILECSSDFYIGMPFEEFVEVVCNIPDSEADYHFCSQIYLLLYPDGEFPINYFCNIENLDFHLEEIKSKTGIPFASLPKLNSTKKSRYELAYTQELIEKVKTRYSWDIQVFNYEFGKKNDAFPFGLIASDFEKRLTESPLMFQLLKEKNREMAREVKFQNANLFKKVNNEMNRKLDKQERQFTYEKNQLNHEKRQLTNKINWLTKRVRILEGKIEALKNSLSWKITSPLRDVIAFFKKD